MIRMDVVNDGRVQVLWLRQFSDIVGVVIDDFGEVRDDSTVVLYLISGNIQVTTWGSFKRFQRRLVEQV